MIDNIAVGKNIARLRQDRNMTQQQLAAALSVSHQAVSKWETGAALPDIETLMALTNLFGVTMEQLLKNEIPQDRFEAETEPQPQKPERPVTPLEGAFRDIGNFVNGIFKPAEKKEEDDGAADPASVEADAEAPETELEAEDEPAGDKTGETAEPEGDAAFDAARLLQMAPFMSKAAVDELLLENRDKLTPADIAKFAPFISPECLEKLIRTSGSEINWDVLRKIAPFLKREMVDKLARAASKGEKLVRDVLEQGGTTPEELGKNISDGVEKVIRKVGQVGESVANEVTRTFNSIVGSAKPDDRAAALRKAACERALQDEKWDWLAAHMDEIQDEELRRAIAQKANGLGMHDWVLEHLKGYADTRTIDAAIESGDWGWLGDHVWQFEDELQERIALAAAQAENWQWLSIYAEQIALDSCADQIGIAAYKADARVLARQLAERSMSAEQRESLANAALEAGDDDFVEQLGDLLTPAYFGRLCVARAQNGDWDGVRRFLERADNDSVQKMMELAIAEGNFDAVDLLDPRL